MENKRIAIMYDFDKTLCEKDMQEYSFIPNLGINPKDFWQEATDLRKNDNMDSVLSYMYLMKDKMEKANKPLTKEYLKNMGKNIELFPGVEDWFKRINEYGKKFGITIEHYIISSGIKEIIEGSSIGDQFKCIFASEFYYNDKGNAVWPLLAINYTNKTQYLIRINKGALDISDDYNINKKMQDIDKRIEVSNMIYVGDGITDVPCMKLTKDGGGTSIAVYTKNNINTAKGLKEDERINYIVPANYKENSPIDIIVKKKIEAISIINDLKDLSLNN